MLREYICVGWHKALHAPCIVLQLNTSDLQTYLLKPVSEQPVWMLAEACRLVEQSTCLVLACSCTHVFVSSCCAVHPLACLCGCGVKHAKASRNITYMSKSSS